MYTLLYVKWTTSKDLLWHRKLCLKCHLAAWMGGESGGEWIRGYVWLSLFAVPLELSQQCELALLQNIKFFKKIGD